MMMPLPSLAILLLIFVLQAPSATTAGKLKPFGKNCVSKPLPLETICNNAPIIRKLDLAAYTGQWYQTFTTGFASRFSLNRCVTANYTLRADGKIDVLNCAQDGVDKPVSCARAEAARRFPDDPKKTAALGVQFFPSVPPGQYNVAATIGFASYGYEAAAVFSCERAGGGPGRPSSSFSASASGRLVPGFFIIARSPFGAYFALKRLRARLLCKGYSVPFKDFVPSAHPPSCKYQGLEGSFSVRPPSTFGASLPTGRR